MRSSFGSLLVLVLSSLPVAAAAQTLTIEVDATVEGAPAAAPPVALARPSEPRDGGEAPVVVLVPAPEVVERPAVAPERPVVIEPAPLPRPVVEEPAHEETSNDAQAFVGLSGWAEQMNLSGLGLTLAAPEVQALSGVQLSSDWAGMGALRSPTVGGIALAVGMRAQQFIRGPELRFYLGGGDVSGPWAPAPGVEGMELAVQSVLVFRAEVALGVQLPLGPVTPYVLGIASVGGAWIDLGVRDARLGELGTETVDALMLQLGIEAGLAFQIAPEVELGAAFRGSFLGVESYGGVVTLGFDSED